MTAELIKGSEIAKQIREELRTEIAELKGKHGVVPGLVTVLVGADPASQVYVGAKEKTSKELGIYSERHDLPAETTQEELMKLIDRLNTDDRINGILVQLPLPKHLNAEEVLYAINPKKDVDGFHPVNVGKLMIGQPDYIPCTPHGVYQLLVRSGISIKGQEVVMVGASNIVGRPLAMLLALEKEEFGATVTLCHIMSRDISIHTKRADILIVAVGKPKLVTADMVKDGVVVIDVGVNEIGRTAEGKRILAGDVDFDAIKEKAKAITPVPGGVGPMTITMLMMNTVRAAKIAAGLV